MSYRGGGGMMGRLQLWRSLPRDRRVWSGVWCGPRVGSGVWESPYGGVKVPEGPYGDMSPYGDARVYLSVYLSVRGTSVFLLVLLVVRGTLVSLVGRGIWVPLQGGGAVSLVIWRFLGFWEGHQVGEGLWPGFLGLWGGHQAGEGLWPGFWKCCMGT